MKIKSYRAPSLREALLQIKEELGEDALVIETKQIRAGGFLGVGAQNLIEVRVAPSPKLETEERPVAAKAQKGARFSLTEDSAAAPARAPAPDDAPPAARAKTEKAKAEPAGQRFGTLAALAARATAGYGRQPAPKPEPKREEPKREDRAASRPPRQVVELADTAPRIVHRRPAPKSPTLGEELLAAPPPTTTSRPTQRDAVNSELARLRAELREVKFALGAFTARPAVPNGLKANKAAEIDAALSNSPFYEVYRELTATGLAPELARQAIHNLPPPGPRELDADVHSLGLTALTRELPAWIQFANAVLGPHEVAAFIGPTGVGKTTTIAKLAAHIALRARRRVELVTLDTYRIAAVQQLKTYAEIIGAGCHVANSVVELDALTRRFAGSATVLIDTTGRSPHDLADQLELADFLRGNESLSKCMVLPATTQMGDAQHALNKFALYGVNRLVLTKLDETVQPGAAVSVAALAGLPLIYLCAGQRVPEDLERATPAALAARVLRPRVLASAAA